MRRPFTTKQAIEAGISKEALKWRVRVGSVQRVFRGVYLNGTDSPTDIERALAETVVSDGVISFSLAAILYGLDSVNLTSPYFTAHRYRKNGEVRDLPIDRIVECRGYRCTDGTQTMIDLASALDDITWEQALEAALRKKLTTISKIEAELPALTKSRTAGITRIRRVLALRPLGAPPTESLLETLAVQLIRSEPLLPVPDRQFEVLNAGGNFVARVDLAFVDRGVFLELDGGHHKDQPKYDANRQTAIVAATRWLPARFTWDDIAFNRAHSVRRLLELVCPTPR